MLASLSESTLKQYETSFKSWWKFCQEKNIEPLEYSITHVLSFLKQEFERGLSYSSLNSFRSALAIILSPDLGVANLRPSLPKYEAVWDPDRVLMYLGSLYPNSSISLELLTYKLVTLLALLTAHRVQTLTLIEIENIVRGQSGVEIKIPAKIKTSSRSKPQPMLVLPCYNDNPAICPVNTLYSYLDRTKKLRPPACKRLLLTFKKPIHEASTQSVSRWIKCTLFRSGVDTSLFSAHSTRHAATSMAKRKGVNLDTIRRTAGWSEHSNVFARFYDRPIVNKYAFANSIVN
ncbi:hypothetical protein NQ315_000452 [Exocentrus adspersus]|uniref:Tyr recombinase domain-containing protein n=1 Tax=Exocentrus adspersus TaxID=1586481 RepID=A0AAV8V7A5_9CUCU|nr:hypothetical protein NQ315_000452 [Exocentrus adspersus]